MNPIIPTIFAKSKKEFEERFNKVIKISNQIQIDFMDGDFVSSNSVSLSQIPNLKRYKKKFEAHLMVKDPENYIKSLKEKGFYKVIFHIEISKKPERISELLKKCASLGLEPWLALNPETSEETVLPFLSKTKGILFMGVHPGREHQELISSVLKKSKNLRKIAKSTKTQLDGGANEKTIPLIAGSGINYVNSGSYISESQSPIETLKKLNNLFKIYKRK